MAGPGTKNKTAARLGDCFLCWRTPIFPGRHQPSIFGTNELNFRVRDGNGWTLVVINTNYSVRVRPHRTASICYHNPLGIASFFYRFFSKISQITTYGALFPQIYCFLWGKWLTTRPIRPAAWRPSPFGAGRGTAFPSPGSGRRYLSGR